MKPGSIFQGLKNGDPRAVAAVSALVFFGSVLWFSWTMFGGGGSQPLPVGDGRPPASPPRPTPLGEVILAQQELQLPDQPPNPFFRPYVRVRRPDPPPRRPDPPPRRPDPPPRPQPPEPEPPPPPPRPVVTYVFRGMIRRPDGTRAALVHNAATGANLFVIPGSELPPYSVVAVDADTVHLSGEGETTTQLLRGEPQTFTLP